MVELEIITGNGKTAAEFKIYTEIYGKGSTLNAKLILEPINAANKGVNIFLTNKEYSNNILTHMDRIPITPDTQIRSPITYELSEKKFYVERNPKKDFIVDIVGLICYDLGIGEYIANPTNYEYDLHDNAKDYPYTDFIEIETILLDAVDLSKIANYHVVLEYDGMINIIDLVKYERVKPKLSVPKSIKGANDESCLLRWKYMMIILVVL